MLKRVHVNRHNIAANRKAGNKDLPPWTVKTGNGKNYPCYTFIIHGDSEVQSVYQPEDPMKCGAVAWLETRAPMTVFEGIGDTWTPLL